MPSRLTDLPPEIICRIIQHISFDPNLTRNLSDLFEASQYLLEIARYVLKREPQKYMMTIGFAIKVFELERQKGKRLVFPRKPVVVEAESFSVPLCIRVCDLPAKSIDNVPPCVADGRGSSLV